jgi:hypothetical protein
LDRLIQHRVDAHLEGGDLVVRQVEGTPIPDPLRREIRQRRDELVQWLQWEAEADALWRALFRRHAHRVDLAQDERFQELIRRAEKAHARHNQERLVRWLLAMERHANQTADQGEAGSRSFQGLDQIMREPARRTL